MRWAFLITLLLAGPVSAQEFFTLKGHGGPIMDIAVSPNGEVATASFDNSVGVWDGLQPRWMEGHRAAVNAVGFKLNDAVISGGDDFTVRFWSESSDRILGEHTAKVTDVAVPLYWAEAATASWDSTIRIWGLVERNEGSRLLKAPSPVNAVAYSKDEQELFAATKGGEIIQYDIGEPETYTTQILLRHGFGINELIVTEDWLAYGATDGGTRIVDLETGEQIADFTLERRPILSMAYAPATKVLAVGDGQGYIMLIDTEARRITHDFRASRSGPIWALAFSPDGQSIYAGGIEDIVYVWPVATMTEHEPMSGGKRTFLEDPKSLPNGERQFKRKCSICHTLTAGSARKAGPSLHGLFGRRAGTVADYTYSDTLNGSDIVWSAQTINALFDLGPDHYVPGTKMPMQRIVKQKDRDDLIDYLRAQTAQKEE